MQIKQMKEEHLLPTERFEKWFRGRGEGYKELKMNFYMDGEPYFSRGGAEMSLSDFLRREEELTNPDTPKE